MGDSQTNRALDRLLGYPPGTLIGRPVELLVPEQLRARHVGLRAQYQHAPAVRQMACCREIAARRQDGGALPVEIWLGPLACNTGSATPRSAAGPGPACACGRSSVMGDLQTNRALDLLLGYPPGTLIGRPVELLVPEQIRARHVGLRAQYQHAPALRQMACCREIAARRRARCACATSSFAWSPVVGLQHGFGHTALGRKAREACVRVRPV